MSGLEAFFVHDVLLSFQFRKSLQTEIVEWDSMEPIGYTLVNPEASLASVSWSSARRIALRSGARNRKQVWS